MIYILQNFNYITFKKLTVSILHKTCRCMQRSTDRHSDRYVPRKKFALRQICDLALRFFGGFDFARSSSSLLPSALGAASAEFFSVRD